MHWQPSCRVSKCSPPCPQFPASARGLSSRAKPAPATLLPAERSAIEGLGGETWKGDLAALLDSHSDPRVASVLRDPLIRLCARYLLHERTPSGRALDPVAHFHLSNGARVERLNWLGDTSPKGLQQSGGIMVNYLYRLSEIETNHEAYRGEGRVAASSTIRNLLRAG